MVREANDIAGDHIRKLLRVCLERSEAMPLNGLVSYLGMDQESIDRELSRLVDQGEVEVLRPVGSESNEDPVHCRRDYEFYRMVRETDRDYLWEHEMHVQQHREKSIDERKLWRKRPDAVRELDYSVLNLLNSVAIS